MRIVSRIILVAVTLISSVNAYGTDVYRVKRARFFLSDTAKFCYDILNRALAATYQSPNDFRLEYTILDGDEQTRHIMRDQLYTDMVDITFAVTRPHWEKQLLVVRVPLLMGYMSYRVSLIHQDNVAKFSQITQLNQLKQLSLGAGRRWATASIHKQLGFGTLEAENPVALAKLLAKKRIDYFPRGVTEILGEYGKFKADYNSLVIEPNIMFYVPVPLYFFVNPHKRALARRLHQGLLILIDNGTYQKVFNQYFGDFSQKLNIQNRTVFKLDNPDLSQESLNNVMTFWNKYSHDSKR